MKLLILTCLVAAALAVPRFRLRQAVLPQLQQQGSSDEQQEIVKQPMYLRLNEDFVNNLNRQRELLTGEQIDGIKVTMDASTEEQTMASAQQEDSSISSSSEEAENAIPSTIEKQIPTEDILNRCTLEQLQRHTKYNQLCQQAVLAQPASLFQQEGVLAQPASLVQPASLFQQEGVLAQPASLVQPASLFQQEGVLAQPASLVQEAFLAQKHLPRLSEPYYPNMEQPYRMNEYSQVQMRQPMSVMDQPFPQVYAYSAFPFWGYLPQDMQYLTPDAAGNNFKPIVPKDVAQTYVWW